MAPGAKRKKILKKVKINFHISKIILIFVINKNASDMKRVIHNPVFMDLNEKQFEYLANSAYAETDPEGTTWVQIFEPFTMDELNEIFDELEKLEEDPIITRLMGLEVVCGGRLGKIININEGYECTILYANQEGVIEHIMALREEDTHIDAILKELED